LLAETFSPPPVSRGDETGGLFADSYRGYVVKEVPLPVQFQFASTRFTSKGEQVAAYLLDYLVSSNFRKIRLVGHTDPVGGDAYNRDLSLRRAEAVKAYLTDGGYAGEIEVEGHGESEPFEPVDPEKFENDVEAKHQLDRRVELVRNPDY
jgi:outer membrane protein OmpA-like peptidoglycan-associated protein